MRKPEQQVQKSRGKLWTKTAEQFSVDKTVMERLYCQIKMHREKESNNLQSSSTCAPYCFPNQITPMSVYGIHHPYSDFCKMKCKCNLQKKYKLTTSKSPIFRLKNKSTFTLTNRFILVENAISRFLLQNFLLLL